MNTLQKQRLQEEKAAIERLIKALAESVGNLKDGDIRIDDDQPEDFSLDSLATPRRMDALERLSVRESALLQMTSHDAYRVALWTAMAARSVSVFVTPGSLPYGDEPEFWAQADALRRLRAVLDGLPGFFSFEYLADSTNKPVLADNLRFKVVNANLPWFRYGGSSLSLLDHVNVFADRKYDRYEVMAYLPTYVQVARRNGRYCDQAVVCGKSQFGLNFNSDTGLSYSDDGKSIELTNVDVSWQLPSYPVAPLAVPRKLGDKMRDVYSVLGTADRYTLTIQL